jgi:aldose 1-epimerase
MTVMIRSLICSFGLLTVMMGGMEAADTKAGLTKTAFGKTTDGQPIDLYTLTNSHGMQATITNYGGTVVSLLTPDRAGHMDDVVLGFDRLEGYLQPEPFFGAIIGRYGNRIGHAMFKLGDKEYRLAKNDGDNTLHGGTQGFDKRVWTALDLSKVGPALELKYTSKDGEEGFPGNLSVTVIYMLTETNELWIEYSAATDRTTVLNLTNHSYFNLAGQGNGEILKHQITINADRFTPVDAGLIPTGELQKVEGTPFDLRQATEIGAHINDDDEQLKLGKGYDHNFVLNRRSGDALTLAARVTEPGSGRVMEVLTSEPGVQFYTGNFLDGTLHGKGGKVYGRRYGLCLETQLFPDSPNKPAFPTTELKPGQKYTSTTVYRFKTSK